MIGRFTVNKQVVRDLQCEVIRRRFAERLGTLRYFGLCSPEMKDVRDWAPLFSMIVAAERGEDGQEFRDQHRLLVTAAQYGLIGKLGLLRGDIDDIIMTGADSYGNAVRYPFDVVSLDYSGGLFYRNGSGSFKRLRAMETVIHRQTQHGLPFLLLISCNTDGIDTGEVKHTIENIRTELLRGGWNAEEVCGAYLEHSNNLVRLRVYVPYLVSQLAAGDRYHCHSERVIAYRGNRGVQMLNYRLWLKPDQRTLAPRFPQERLSQVMNAPMILIENGEMREENFDLPKLRIQIAAGKRAKATKSRSGR
jgi:hypothetical protein